MDHLLGWSVFCGLILGMLVLDLAVAHRRPHAVSLREAAAWSAVWVTLALLFGVGVVRFMGAEAGLQYFTGWLIEKALSVDNIFVFVVLFTYFGVPPEYQHRVLFWGVLGALVMRGVMIGAGVVLLERFHWLIYVLGTFLVLTGVKLFRRTELAVHPERNPALRLLRRVVPVTQDYHGERFFARTPAIAVTPLFVVLVLVESTDLIFAVDSIPAIFAVTRDPFIIYTSNVFAILGLRSLYFLLAGVVHRFYYLRPGLAVVLVFVGVKMLAGGLVEVPVTLSLGVIALVLAAAMVASLLFPPRSAASRSIA